MISSKIQANYKKIETATKKFDDMEKEDSDKAVDSIMLSLKVEDKQTYIEGMTIKK